MNIWSSTTNPNRSPQSRCSLRSFSLGIHRKTPPPGCGLIVSFASFECSEGRLCGWVWSASTLTSLGRIPMVEERPGAEVQRRDRTAVKRSSVLRRLQRRVNPIQSFESGPVERAGSPPVASQSRPEMDLAPFLGYLSIGAVAGPFRIVADNPAARQHRTQNQRLLPSFGLSKANATPRVSRMSPVTERPQSGRSHRTR